MFWSILKVDSTKVCEEGLYQYSIIAVHRLSRMQGAAGGSATWVTNVANGRGEDLMSANLKVPQVCRKWQRV